jgi:hypothetical protein
VFSLEDSLSTRIYVVFLQEKWAAVDYQKYVYT